VDDKRRQSWRRLYLIQGIGAAFWVACFVAYFNTRDQSFIAIGTVIFIVFGLIGWIAFSRR